MKWISLLTADWCLLHVHLHHVCFYARDCRTPAIATRYHAGSATQQRIEEFCHLLWGCSFPNPSASGINTALMESSWYGWWCIFTVLFRQFSKTSDIQITQEHHIYDVIQIIHSSAFNIGPFLRSLETTLVKGSWKTRRQPLVPQLFLIARHGRMGAPAYAWDMDS